MLSISGYLKEWFSTTKYILTHPRNFFKEMPTSGSLKEPLNFMVFTIFIVSMLSMPIIMLTFADYLSEVSLSRIILAAAGLFVIFLFFMAISVPLNALTYHILLRICGANGNLTTTLRVFCYYMSSSIIILPVIDIIMLIFYIAEKKGLGGVLFSVVPIVLLIAVIILLTCYAFYVLLVGFSEAHRMSVKRVILAIVGIPLAINILLAAIPAIIMFLS